ncbi:hypothetical protein [Streptomyces sp. SID7909]|uniref:hypothetical protein n=1 Tax=Streptomyces sp. SID7909 TaxID=2706092 RepID=UPI0013B62640|nr:hypothetical protein [Streptomyces sp. SID7909]NEC10208.1 hypothetical protein [Streptomyces sp. SID7909]
MTFSRDYGAWGGEALTELHRTLMWQMLRFVSVPLAGDTCQVVRGVLQPPERCDVTRVVMWDGRDLDSSVAYDLPLIENGDNISWSDLIAAVRSALGEARRHQSGMRGPLGVPVVDLSGEVLRFLTAPVFDLTDALHSAASVFRPLVAEYEEGVQMSGFLLLDRDVARLYVDGPTLEGRVGLDVTLQDGNGCVVGGHTALMATLPSLLSDGLGEGRSGSQDPYCTTVHDLTQW